MSNIDKQALRNLARRATPGPWTMEHENIWYYENGFTKHLAYFCQGDDVDDSQDDVNTRYVAAADPSTVLALLDELEAVQKTSAARLVAIDTTHKMFQRERDRAEKAEKRIAELEAREVKLPERYEVEMCPTSAPNGDWYSREDVLAALVSAGVRYAEAAGKGE